VRGAGAERGRNDATGKIGQQQAASQLQRNLHPGGRGVVFHPEEPEAEGQKERIAGQPDQRGNHRAATPDEGIAAVQQQVPGQFAVDQRVPVDQKELLQHTQAQRQAGEKSQRDGQGGSHTRNNPIFGCRLTLEGGFHTILTV
jgi:hypothetical protein